ncbi:MAG: AAA family ATPase [Desulfobacteraceae bacterium]|nr:AAA family ATPase [Desulfobacteraceae bacterium]
MESAAEPGTIFLSENTQKLVRDFFDLEALGEIQVKGKTKLQKAFRLIKTGDVETRIGASVAKGLTRFVGRQKSMATLIDAFERVRSESGQVVGIVGEPGVGKSRLLLEMRNKIPPDEYRYVEGRCLQYGGSILYLPILDILKSIFNIKEGDNELIIKRKIKNMISTFGDEFNPLNSPFQDMLSLTVDDEAFITLEPKGKREKIFESLRDLLIRMSQDKPLIIAVEDLHWIDKTSEEFLHYLMDWLANAKILLILLYRPEYTHPWGSKSFYTKIGVNQLGLSSSGDLVRAILAEGDVAPELSGLILGRAAGNPLFMEEFTHALLENGSIEKQNSRYALKGNPGEVQIPDTVQGIIAARLDRLEDNLKRTLQVASVIGRDFAFKILQTIIGIRTELKSYLLNLQGLEFIYEKNLFPELEYIFKHALTQEVAYNSLLQKRRKEIHEKIGMAIENLYPERLEEFYEMLAYHYSRSDNIDKAIQYCKLAGQKAENNYAHWEAFYFYKDAFDILDKHSETESNIKEKLKLLTSMEPAFVALGLPDEALWGIEKKIEYAKKLGDSSLASRYYINKANYHSHRGNLKLALEYSENAFNEALTAKNLELMISSAWALSVAYAPAGESLKTVAIVPEIINLIEKEDRKADYFQSSLNAYSVLCLYCGIGFGNLGDFQTGLNYLQKSLDNAKSVNDVLIIGGIEIGFGIHFVAKGDWNSSILHLKKSIEHSREVNFSWIEALCHCIMGYAYAKLGDFKTGADLVEIGIEKHTQSGVEMFLAESYSFAGGMFLESGNFSRAEDLLEKAVELSSENAQKIVEGNSKIRLGTLFWLSEPNQVEKAVHYISEGIQILETLMLKPYYSIGYLNLAEIYLKMNDTQKAVQNLKIADEIFRETGMEFWQNQAQKLWSDVEKKN